MKRKCMEKIVYLKNKNMRRYSSNVTDEKRKKRRNILDLGEVEELGTRGLPNSTLAEPFSYLPLHHKGRRVRWLRVKGIATQIPM